MLQQLYDGPNDQAPLIGSFCGSQPPPANGTTSSALTLVFRSDSSVSRLGFQMMWYQSGKIGIAIKIGSKINNKPKK